jgi:Xaa-Pro aminopeptidase
MQCALISSREVIPIADELVVAKVKQAIDLLVEFDLPVWIVQFARETYEHPEPVQRLAVGTSVTWPAAFIVSAAGDSIAIIGTGDAENVRRVGAYEEVIGYVKDVAQPLRDVLDRLAPARIGLSYSIDDDSADNLAHGMYLMLQACLRGTAHAERLVSADHVLVALRARKLPQEINRIRGAIDTTLNILDEVEAIIAPGMTEIEIANAVRGLIWQARATEAWEPELDPIVNLGPGAKFGHVAPGHTVLEPGMLIHVDLGIKREGYCSDLQRVWYLLREDEDAAPPDVLKPFDTVLRSMQAGFNALRPGVSGWEVDAAARTVISQAGYDEPEFALGHQLGQTAHDGGCLLGPRWPRYGSRPEMKVEAGNVFTLEYALPSPAGPIGQEEDVLVTPTGAEYLSRPQTELVCLRR